MSQPGRDAIEAGAGPIGEAIIGAASGGAAGLVRDIPAAVAGTLKSVSGELAPGAASRAAALGVTTTNEGSAAIPFSQRYISGDASDRVKRLLKVTGGAAGFVSTMLPGGSPSEIFSTPKHEHKDATGALPPEWARNWKPGDPVPK